MRLKVYSIFDKQLSVYSGLYAFANDIQADRYFENVLKQNRGDIANHPDYFSLQQVAEFDDAVGRIEPVNPVVVFELAKYFVSLN